MSSHCLAPEGSHSEITRMRTTPPHRTTWDRMRSPARSRSPDRAARRRRGVPLNATNLTTATKRVLLGQTKDQGDGARRAAPVDRAVDVRMSISGVPDPGAIGAGSRAGRRNDSCELPRAPGLARRARRGRPNEERAAPPGAARQQPRGAARQPRWPGPLDRSMTVGSAGAHEPRPCRQERAPRLIFAVGAGSAKVQLNGPDGILGTHRIAHSCEPSSSVPKSWNQTRRLDPASCPDADRSGPLRSWYCLLDPPITQHVSPGRWIYLRNRDDFAQSPISDYWVHICFADRGWKTADANSNEHYKWPLPASANSGALHHFQHSQHSQRCQSGCMPTRDSPGGRRPNRASHALLLPITAACFYRATPAGETRHLLRPQPRTLRFKLVASTAGSASSNRFTSGRSSLAAARTLRSCPSISFRRFRSALGSEPPSDEAPNTTPASQSSLRCTSLGINTQS